MYKSLYEKHRGCVRFCPTEWRLFHGKKIKKDNDLDAKKRLL